MKNYLFTIIFFTFHIPILAQSKTSFKGENNLYGIKDENGKIIIAPEYNEIDVNSVFGYIDEISVVVRINDKFGVIDSIGSEIISVKYDNIVNIIKRDSIGRYAAQPINEPYYQVKQNNKFGLFDKNGKPVLPIQFDEEFGGSIYYNLFIVSQNDKSGIATATGEIIVPIQYDEIRNIYGEIFEVQHNGKWGVVDLKNNVVIPFLYDNIMCGGDVKDVFGVQHNGKWGLVNAENKLITFFKYDSIYSFNSYDLNARGYIYVKLGGNDIKIDKQGNELFVDNEADTWLKEERQMILNHKIDIKEIYPYNQAEKVEIIAFYSKQNDYKNLLKGGKITLLPDEIDDRKFLNKEQIYKLAQLFNNPAVKNCDISANCYDPKHLIVFYDKKGNVFTFIELCLECFETLTIDKEIKKHKICDKNIELLYDLLGELGLNYNPQYYHYLSEKSAEGLYKVEHRGKVGFLDENKNIVIPFIYDSEENDEEIGRILDEVHDFETGIIEIQMGFRFKEYTGFQWGVCAVIKDGKYGLINTKNEIVVPFIYDGIDGIGGGFPNDSGTYKATDFIAKKDGKYGIVGIDGTIIKDFIYSLIVLNNTTYFRE